MECSKQLGIECLGWEAREVPNQGYRGAVAMSDIPTGSLLCRVPASSAWVDDVSSSVIPSSFISAKFWKSKAADGPSSRQAFLRLAVRLLYEKRIGAKSKWAAYIDSLPKDYSSLASHWEDISCLQWQPLASQIAQEKAMVKEQHAQLVKLDIW
jgi:hypothetical protein